MNSKRAELIKKYYQNKLPNAELLIDNVWDPHNVAAILRSADGLGISKVSLYYTYNKYPDLQKHGKKSSATANKWIKVEKITNLKKFIQLKKSKKFKFIALDCNPKSKILTEFKFPKKSILILGSEKDGISPELNLHVNQTLFIPMVGMVQSYNVSVAAAIALYELFRQKGKKLILRQ